MFFVVGQTGGNSLAFLYFFLYGSAGGSNAAPWRLYYSSSRIVIRAVMHVVLCGSVGGFNAVLRAF